MGKKFSNLLSPGRIGKMSMPNRIVMAPMGTLNADKDGYVTDRTIKFYKEQAQGEMAMIIVEATYVDEWLSMGEDNSQGLTRNGEVTKMAQLASVIQDQGVYAILQLAHMGKQISLAGEKESLGPSEMIDKNGGVMPFPIRGITREEIRQLKEDYAAAAWRAKMAGVDGVEIHGAIDHLINMFCSPYYNRRTDEYGGSPENRIRFMCEIIEDIHKMCGKDFPVIARICGNDFTRDGISMEEGIIHARELEKRGIVALHVVAGSTRNIRIINIQYDKRGDFVETAANLKKAGIKVPVIIDGGLTTPELAEKVLADGSADYIGLGRPMLADPDWAKKLSEDRPDDIVPCIRCCKGCVGTLEHFNAAAGLRCSVNPRCNMSDYREIIPAAKTKKVCIVGGGPAGMEAARVACLRGHDVTLYEMRKLGGTMHEAAFDPKLKEDIVILTAYYRRQMEKMPVRIIHEEATAEKIIAGDYDAVIIAAGAEPISANVKGEGPAVEIVHEYAGRRELPAEDEILIVGGCFYNLEIAYALAKAGKRVTVSSRRGAYGGKMQLADDASSPMQQRLLGLCSQYKVQFEMCVNLVGINENGAVFQNVISKETKTVPCERVIICKGLRGRNKLCKELEGKIPKLYQAGDCTMSVRCVDKRDIGDAILDGWRVGARV